METGLLMAMAAAALAGEITIGKLEHFTENRGPNDAGVGPTHQVVVTATIVPSGFPTLAFAQQGSVREPMSHFAATSTPHLYAHWHRFERASPEPWQVIVERATVKAPPVLTRRLANPQKVPLVNNLRVTGEGLEPRLSWELPDLAGFDIDRIRVAVRAGRRVQGRFLEVVYISHALPPDATAFRMPAGVLVTGQSHIFQVMLEDLEDGELENRSLTFTAPYTPR